MKAATDIWGQILAKLDISIHAAREGGDEAGVQLFVSLIISIHAAREGGDYPERRSGRRSAISIHAAREGGDRLFPPPKSRA